MVWAEAAGQGGAAAHLHRRNFEGGHRKKLAGLQRHLLRGAAAAAAADAGADAAAAAAAAAHLDQLVALAAGPGDATIVHPQDGLLGSTELAACRASWTAGDTKTQQAPRR